MPTFNALGQRLAQLKGELISSPLFSTGRPSRDADAEREASRVERIQAELELILRDLKSSESLALVQRASLLSNVERTRRWAASQSLEQRLNDIRGLKDEANQLAGLVRELLDRNRPNLLQAGAGSKELIENFEKAFGHSHHGSEATLGLAHGNSFYAAPLHSNLDPGVSSLVPAIIFAISGLKWLAAHLRGNDQH